MSTLNRMKKWALSFMSILVLVFVSCKTNQPSVYKSTDLRPNTGTYTSLAVSETDAQIMPEPLTAKTEMAEVTATQGEDGKINTDLFSMMKSVPNKASIGESYKVVIDVTAKNNLASIQIKDSIPEGTELVKSDPQPSRLNDQLMWNFGPITSGESKSITMWLKPVKEGVVGSCATVTAIPRCCVTTMIGKAQIELAKSGPSQAILGEMVKYNMVITNKGNAIAKNVVITDIIPEGFAHASGDSSMIYRVGNLNPGESKSYSIDLKSTQRGKLCNVAQASSANAGEVKDEACTLIVQPGLQVAKTGTDKQFVGKVADYKIVVTNTGDTVLKNVIAKDRVPEGATIVKAGGGQVENNYITWSIPTLDPGAKREYMVSLKSMNSGTLCNAVSVKDSTGLSSNAKVCTVWRGHPALLLEVVDMIDPLLPGEKTTYVIRITNQGTANDNNVGFSATFPDEIKPLSVKGSTSGEVNANGASVKVFAILKPKQVIEWKIEAQALKAGDARIKIKMFSDLLKKPVNEEESTHVY